MDRRMWNAARWWHLITFLVGAFAVVLQLVLVIKGHQHLGETEPGTDDAGAPSLGTQLVRFASYLTIWSNVLGTAIAATLALNPARDGRVWRPLRLNAVAILLGVAIVHWFFLRPLLDLHGPDFLADKLLHIVVPLLVAIGWLAFGPRARITPPDLGRFMILPAIWLAYTLIRGAIVDWYPYPFVDVTLHGYAYVTVAALAIGALLLALAAGCLWLDRKLPTPTPAHA